MKDARERAGGAIKLLNASQRHISLLVLSKLTTVFPKQGHYAHDPKAMATYPPADVSIQRIGDLVDYDLSMLLGACKPK